MKKLLITTFFATFVLSASATELPKECLEVKEIFFTIMKETHSMDDINALWADLEKDMLAKFKVDPNKAIAECKLTIEMLEPRPQQ